MHRKGIFCTALSALLFGVTPLLGRLTYGMGSNALTLTFYRNALVILPIFLLLRLRKISLRISPRQLATVLAVGILGRPQRRDRGSGGWWRCRCPRSGRSRRA